MFVDRKDAGLQLAEKLNHYKNRGGVLVLALPRGGAVTGFEIANTIGATLDVLIVRKMGFLGQPELAIGALSETGAVALNEDVISYGGGIKEVHRRCDSCTERGDSPQNKTLTGW